jgi:hypothetical protein
MARLPTVRGPALVTIVALASVLAGCGTDATPVHKGDCTDADPTLMSSAIKPGKVSCDSPKATSRVVAEVTAKSDCGRAVPVAQDGGYVCLQGLRGRTFREQIDRASRRGAAGRTPLVEQLKKGITKTATTP